MTSALILINGMPASGKSTLAESAAYRLGWPVLSADTVKEALADLVRPTVPSERLGAIARETAWRLAGAAQVGVVVEAFWWRWRDLEHVEHGLRTAGDPQTVELWCAVPPEVAADRYEDADAD